MQIVRNFLLGAVAALGLALPAVAAERAIIVLDGSGSMWAQIDGKARITIARETLREVLATLPGDLELGFMTYGHREKGNCGDIEVLIEPAAGTGGAIAAAADAINPKGMTPISDAVRLAAEDLQFTEQKATVILITDGLETCEVDPCALASDLESRGIDFTTHVLGFGLSDEEGQQVACLAENTGGKYLSANDGAALVEALTTAVAQVAQAEPAPEPEPEPVAVLEHNIVPTVSLAEGGADLYDDRADLVWELHAVAADGSVGERLSTEYNSDAKFSAEPGDYYLQVRFGRAESSQKITVAAGELSEPHFVLNAGIVKVRALAQAGAEPDNDAMIRLHYPNDQETTFGDGTFRVPGGEEKLVITLGAVVYEETFTLAAGETVEKEIVLGAGLAVLDAVYVEGLDVTSSGLSVRIYKAKRSIDGRREQVAYGFGPGTQHDLPPGDYVATFEMEAATVETEFSVKAGERVDVVGYLNAGVMAFSTPGAEISRVYGAKKAIDGSRSELAYSFDKEWQTTLAEGDYVIATRYPGDVMVEKAFSVKAGERFELTIAAPPAVKKK